MKTSRVLVVYGSETNQTHNAMKEIVDKWNSQGKKSFTVTEFLEGDDAAKKISDINSSNYDFLLVGTSSYGEGEAPGGFGKFLYHLQEAAKSNNKPFKGMQHAVIGFGSTTYETFQNCPRLTDKYLGEAGSIRCLKRAEVDEMEVDGDMAKVDSWVKDIVKIFDQASSAGTANLDPVCDWTEPCDEILNKKMGADGFEVGNGVPEMGLGKLLGAAAVAGISYYWYTRKMTSEDE